MAVGLGLLCSCADDRSGRRCETRIWAQPQRPGAYLEVIGSWNDWHTPGIALAPSDTPGWEVARVDDVIPPGEHGYLILEDGTHRLDEFNPLGTFWAAKNDLEVSLLILPDCREPALQVAEVEVRGADAVAISAEFEPGADGAIVAEASVRANVRGPAMTMTIPADVEAGRQITAEVAGLARGRHSFTVTATTTTGAEVVARASVFVGPAAPEWTDGLLYQVVTDRYRGPGGTALAAPATPGVRAGGVLAGITAELEAGTMTEMGVTALWISPVYTNPIEAREGRGDGKMYEGYHGYWVQESRGVDPKIGGEAALDALIAAAHARGIKVLLDVVPNHIYEANPRFRDRTDDAGFHIHDPPCVCGLGTCDWGTHILTCWFTDYLPDLRLEDPAVLRQSYEDLIWWRERFEVDGLRIDAVPMMPRAVTRRIAHELRTRAAGEPPFLLGEVFTGGGLGGVEVLRYYLGPDGLDSVFDFPLMWAIRDVLAHETAGFSVLTKLLADIDAATAGSGAVLGRMIGNHDVTRFFSEARGDAGGDPWAGNAIQADDPVAFARQRSALALVLTLPGLPVLYYGDEVGLAGATDPDNRRVLPAWDSLSPEQAATKAMVARLGQLRGCEPALRRGALRTVVVDPLRWAFVRGDGEVLVVLSRSASDEVVTLPAGELAPGRYVDVLSDEVFTVTTGEVAIALAPRQPRVLVREASGCSSN